LRTSQRCRLRGSGAVQSWSCRADAVPGRGGSSQYAIASFDRSVRPVRPWEQSRAGRARSAAAEWLRRLAIARPRAKSPGEVGVLIGWRLACWAGDGGGELEPGRDWVGSWLRPPAGERHPEGSFPAERMGQGARDRCSELNDRFSPRWRRHQRHVRIAPEIVCPRRVFSTFFHLYVIASSNVFP